MITERIKQHKYDKTVFSNGSVAFQNIRKQYTGKQSLVGLYLHSVFSGLNSLDLSHFERELGIKIDLGYKKFLTNMNGCKLFSDSLCIYGFGKVLENGVYLISRNPSNPLPFDVFNENNGSIDGKKLKIGSICDDGLFLNNISGAITRQTKTGDEIERWNSIDECVCDLFDRLETVYEENGMCKNPVVIKNLLFNRVKNI